MSRSRILSWWFEPMPRGRVAVLRSVVYLFVFVDVFLTTSWVAQHAHVPTELYQPLFLGRVLPLPEPTAVVIRGVQAGLLVAAAVALSGRMPRIAGAATFLLYLEWMFIAMSYGKVDHDRFAFLVALAVLPTAGSARWGELDKDERAGWALRSIQVAVVLTYLLAAVAKFRFGGPGWVNGATLMRAVLRRGTTLIEPVENHPWVLRVAQWGIVAFELLTPLMLLRGRMGRAFVLVALAFHAITYTSIRIVFLPHVVCLLAFLPLERLPAPATLLRSRALPSRA